MARAKRTRHSAEAVAGPDERMEREQPLREPQVSRGALDRLGFWLSSQGFPLERSARTIQTIATFYEQSLLPALGDAGVVGLIAGTSECLLQSVWLHVVWPTELRLDAGGENRQLINLGVSFSNAVVLPLLPNPAVHMEFYSPSIIGADVDRTFRDVALREADEHFSIEYLGNLRGSVAATLEPQGT